MTHTSTEIPTSIGTTSFAELRSRILRGGRMVKTARGAASIAPLVVAGGIIIAGANGAHAANECGTNTPGPTNIICSSENYAIISLYPNYPNGIKYGGDGLSLTLDDPNAILTSNGISINSDRANTGDISISGIQFESITTSTNNGRGIWASNFGPDGNASARMGKLAGSFNSSRGFSYGILAEIDSVLNPGLVTATMDGGSIGTSGSQGVGVYAFTRGTGQTVATMSDGSIISSGEFGTGIYSFILNSNSTATTTATLNDGTVTTAGRTADGINSRNTGLGFSSSVMNGGTIRTTGDVARGIIAQVGNVNSKSSSSVIMRNGEIYTEGASAHGVYSRSTGLGTVSLLVNGGSIHITGTEADGLRAEIRNEDSHAEAIVTMTAGEVSTEGDNASGITASTSGFGNAIIYLEGTGIVHTSGAGANAISAESQLGRFDVSVLGSSSASVVSNTSAVVKISSPLGGTVLVSDGAVINGKDGFAFWDGDFNQDGSDENAGNAVITTSGTVTGNTIFGLGNDTFNLTGGIYTGDIYGDDAATASMTTEEMVTFYEGLYTKEQLRGINAVDPIGQDDTFNWTGGIFGSSFFGGNGSDTANITTSTYDGTYHVPDGGDDYSVADGWIDELTLGGDVSGDVNGSNVVNWERVFLDGVEISIVDGAIQVGADNGTGLFLLNNAILNAGPSLNLTGNLDIASGSIFRGAGAGAGTYTVSSNLSNAGIINLRDGNTGDVLTVDGNYVSRGGTILLDAFLTGDEALSETDRIEIGGNASGAGFESVFIDNLNTNAATGQEKLLLIPVGGDVSDATFLLQRRVVSGPYEYLLNQRADGNWYLESVNLVGDSGPQGPEGPIGPEGKPAPVMRPEVGAYSANLSAAAGMFDHSWRDRHGAIRSVPEADLGSWLRITGQQGGLFSGDGQIVTDFNRTTLHFGADIARFSTSGQDDVLIGLMGGYVWQNSASVSGITGYGANASIEGWGLGAYASWAQNGFEERGWYADAWTMFGQYDAEITSAGFAAQNYSIDSTTISVETGYAFDVAKQGDTVFWIEPQAQLIWNNTDMDAVRDKSGTMISSGSDSLTSRIGVRAAFTTDPLGKETASTGFLQLDWLNTNERPEIMFDAYTSDAGSQNALRVGAGYEYSFSDNARIGAKIDYTNAQGGNDAVSASLNLNFKF